MLTEASDSRGHALLTEVHPGVAGRRRPGRRRPAPGSCVLRTAPVMDAAAPPLKQLRLLFKLGLGGRLGNGRQHMPMISLRDWVGGVVHLAEHDERRRPVQPVLRRARPTNAEFTGALAAALHRPAFATVPAPAAQGGRRPMSPELLGSLNVRPAACRTSGYAFADPDVDAVLGQRPAREPTGRATRPRRAARGRQPQLVGCAARPAHRGRRARPSRAARPATPTRSRSVDPQHQPPPVRARSSTASTCIRTERADPPPRRRHRAQHRDVAGAPARDAGV